jgi:hypothetical protein
MKCKDSSTWTEPLRRACEDTGYGVVLACTSTGWHKVRVHEGNGSYDPLPIVRETLVLVEVEWLPRGERRREPRALWFQWHGGGPGEATPDLELL